MSTLAAVIITKNEEARIEKCLNSLKGFVDEIIIVDDSSTDRTVEISKNFAAKILVNESKGDFDQQRNLGIDCSESQWIIQMDADEIMPEITAGNIRRALDDPQGHVAFYLKRENYFFGHLLKGEVFSDNNMVKIFKKDSARYVGKSVHETLKVDGPIGRIEGVVLHYPYSSIKEIIAKVNFYTDVVADNFVQNSQMITFKEIKYRLGFKSLKHFWKLYIRKRAFREGMYGFIWCIIKVIVPQIKWLKIWEKAKQNNKLKL